MNIVPNSEHKAIGELARGLAGQDLRKNWARWEETHEFPVETLKKLASHGLMGVNVSKEFGGLEAGVVAYSNAVQAIAWGDPAIAVTMCVNNMVAEVLQEFGDERQKAFIPKLLSGQTPAGSFCLSEAGSGSDAAGMQANARRTDSGYVLNGSKAWITSGEFAGAYLVWSQVENGGKSSISVFFVEEGTPGVSFGAPEEKMGQHASNTVVVNFDDVEVPADALVMDVGQGFKVAMMALDGGRIGIASQALGICDALLEEAGRIGWAASSYWSGRVEAARALVWRAAKLKEEKVPFTYEASVAKLYASECASALGDTILAEAGIEAALNTNFLQKLVRDARVTRIYEGTSEVQKIVIARELGRRLG